MAVRNVQHTSNPVQVYELSWTIDNFSRTPLVFRGPPFCPIAECSVKFCFELKFVEATSGSRCSYLCIYLVCLDGDSNNLNVSYNIKLQINGGTIIAEVSSFINIVQGNNQQTYVTFEVVRKYELPSKLKMLNDKLTVNGTLSFSGYKVNSSATLSIMKAASDGREEHLKDLRSMYESGFAWDVAFSVDGQALHAHKAIICSRSPVFTKMFSLDMKENNSNSVLITDANVHVFNCFLLYLYTSIIEDEGWDTVLILYSLANKYEVRSLRKECSCILGNNITLDSIYSVLALADLHDDKDLKEVGKKFLKANVFQVVGTTQWAELISTKPQLVKEIMESTK